MRCAVYYNNHDIRIEEMPRPRIGAGEVLFKVEACGICGSDVMEWYRVKKAPLVLGHEATGTLAEVSPEVKQYKTGDRVFISHHVPCNSCRYCLSGNHTVCETLHTTNFYPGGFSEYVRVPSINVERGILKLPDEVSFVEGTFIEPLACVLRAQRMSRVLPGQNVLILGAGISGLLHLLLARKYGAAKIAITDINEFRLKKAKELGADEAVNAKENFKEKFDQVIICTGASSAFALALQSVDRAGAIMCFAPTKPGEALPIPVNDFWRNSVKILHSYGAGPEDNARALELIKSRAVPVSKLVTHELKLEEAGLGFKLVAEAKDCVKVVILPNQ